MNILHRLLDLIPSFCSEEYWKSIFQNAIGCTIGSFIAIGATLWIYLKSSRKGEIEKRNNQIREQNDALKYLTASIRNIIPIAKQQNNYIKKFIEKINESEIYLPLLTFITLYEFKRISESNSLERPLLAYTNKYLNDKNSITEFSEIISCIDYLYTEFLILPDQIKRAHEFDNERKTQLQKLFSESFRLLGEYMMNQNFDNLNQAGSEIQAAMNDFQLEHKDNFDIEFYYTNFFIPINDLMVKFLSSGQRLPLFINIAQLTRDGKQLFELIQVENKLLADSLDEISKNIDKGIIKLEKISSKLLQDNLAPRYL